MGSEVVVKLCDDMEFVTHVIHTLWDSVSDDGASIDTWAPSPDWTFLEIQHRGERIGIYEIHPLNTITYQLHANILPQYRKLVTYDISKAVHKWLIENCRPNATKFVACIPACFPNVIEYALGSGWKCEGVMEKAYLKNGETHDLFWVGCTRSQMEGLV